MIPAVAAPPVAEELRFPATAVEVPVCILVAHDALESVPPNSMR
jgi:hypothetical protein